MSGRSEHSVSVTWHSRFHVTERTTLMVLIHFWHYYSFIVAQIWFGLVEEVQHNLSSNSATLYKWLETELPKTMCVNIICLRHENLWQNSYEFGIFSYGYSCVGLQSRNWLKQKIHSKIRQNNGYKFGRTCFILITRWPLFCGTRDFFTCKSPIFKRNYWQSKNGLCEAFDISGNKPDHYHIKDDCLLILLFSTEICES